MSCTSPTLPNAGGQVIFDNRPTQRGLKPSTPLEAPQQSCPTGGTCYSSGAKAGFALQQSYMKDAQQKCAPKQPKAA